MMKDKNEIMNRPLKILTILLISFYACFNSPEKDINANMNKEIKIYEALEIAHKDAEKVYMDLSIYLVSISKENQEWKIDYELKDKYARGGGPHYLIAIESGEIISKRYDQ